MNNGNPTSDAETYTHIVVTCLDGAVYESFVGPGLLASVYCSVSERLRYTIIYSENGNPVSAASWLYHTEKYTRRS
jgi:hypothetical protein